LVGVGKLLDWIIDLHVGFAAVTELHVEKENK
jgi:hypothetical protein